MDDNAVGDQAEGPPMSIGGMITDRVLESIKNMDVATVLQKIVATKPEDEESGIAQQKILGVLEKFKAMNAEEKQIFTEQIRNALASKMSMRLQEKLGDFDETLQQALVNRLLLVGAGIVVLILVLVFFGYKLYKSIRDKQVKREEKKKAKQMKKKK